MMEPTALPPRSTFISVLAWLSIAFTGFGTLIAILQNLMLNLLFPVEQMTQSMQMPEAQAQLPAFTLFMFAHMRAFVGGFLVFFLTLLVFSIALLKRKNWARIGFIIFLAFGIVTTLATPLIQYHLVNNVFVPPMSESGVEIPADFQIIANVMLVFSALMSLGFCALYAWLIKRLVSPSIVTEFRSQGSNPDHL